MYAGISHTLHKKLKSMASIPQASQPQKSSGIFHVAGACLIESHVAAMDVIAAVACRTVMGNECDLSAEIIRLLELDGQPEQ